jgi:PadR family transcriptional regulator, regulatory protein PadR
MGVDTHLHSGAYFHRETMGRHDTLELLPGTLDLLILKTVARGKMHGYGIALQLKATSEDVLEVGESSLYPALQRLLLNGWVNSEWGVSENNRRARYYTITAAGRKRLASERADFERMVAAIQKVLCTS